MDERPKIQLSIGNEGRYLYFFARDPQIKKTSGIARMGVIRFFQDNHLRSCLRLQSQQQEDYSKA